MTMKELSLGEQIQAIEQRRQNRIAGAKRISSRSMRRGLWREVRHLDHEIHLLKTRLREELIERMKR